MTRRIWLPSSTTWLVITMVFITSSMIVPSGASEYSPAPIAPDEPPVEFVEGTAGIGITQQGELTLDAIDQGIGLSPDGSYLYGDPAYPTVDNAFEFSVHTAEARAMTIGYGDTGDAPGHMTIHIFDSMGREVGQVGAESPPLSVLTSPPHATYYGVIEIDTLDMRPGDRIAGSLTVTV